MAEWFPVETVLQIEIVGSKKFKNYQMTYESHRDWKRGMKDPAECTRGWLKPG